MANYQIVIGILATWRLSAMLSYEAGPNDIFIWFRELIGIYHDDTGEIIGDNGSFFAELFTCIWCLSVWIGMVITVMIFLNPVLFWLFLPLALSAGAILTERLIRG